jgi:hypothetical protein
MRSARATASGSLAGTETQLPLAGFADIVLDVAHGRVFVSGGDGYNGLTVLNSAGVVQKTLSGLPGASGMVLSADGSTLFVALANGDAIGMVDTGSLAITKVATGPTTCPTSVAEIAGLVWFGYGCSGASQQVGTLDPTTSTVTLAVITDLHSDVALGASPQAPGVLMLATPNQSPDFLSRYSVTGGPTPTGTVTATINVGSNFGDMAFTPDGGDVIVADGAVYHHQVFSTADLSADGTYATTNYPDSVAVNAGGVIAAGIDGAYSPDIWVFQPGATTPTKKIELGAGNELVQGGLAFTGSTIYAVTGGFSEPYTLHVVSTLPPTKSLSVTTSHRSYAYGGKVAVTVKLRHAGSNQRVAVYGTPLGGQQVLVKKGSLSNGTFLATARVDRRTTFSAVWGGNATHGPTQRSTAVKVQARVVSRLRGYYVKSGRYALYHVAKNPKQVAAVLPNHGGDCLEFRVQKPTTRGGWKPFASTGCVPMSSSSAAGAVLKGTHAVGERVRFQAQWSGDTENLAKNGPWQYARFTH